MLKSLTDLSTYLSVRMEEELCGNFGSISECLALIKNQTSMSKIILIKFYYN